MNNSRNHQIINGITKQIAAKVEQSVEKKIQAIFREKESDQSIANTKYSHQFIVREDAGQIQFHVESGKIEGSFTDRISGYSYNNQNGTKVHVKPHTRTYENQFPFQDKAGNYVVSETVPDHILEELIQEAVTDAFTSK